MLIETKIIIPVIYTSQDLEVDAFSLDGAKLMVCGEDGLEIRISRSAIMELAKDILTAECKYNLYKSMQRAANAE